MNFKSLVSNALALSLLGAIPAHATVYKTEPNEEALEAAYRYGFNFGMATSACLGYYQNYSSRKYWLYTVNYIRKNENYRGEYQDIMENFEPDRENSDDTNEINAYCLKALRGSSQLY